MRHGSIYWSSWGISRWTFWRTASCQACVHRTHSRQWFKSPIQAYVAPSSPCQSRSTQAFRVTQDFFPHFGRVASQWQNSHGGVRPCSDASIQKWSGTQTLPLLNNLSVASEGKETLSSFESILLEVEFQAFSVLTFPHCTNFSKPLCNVIKANTKLRSCS